MGGVAVLVTLLAAACSDASGIVDEVGGVVAPSGAATASPAAAEPPATSPRTRDRVRRPSSWVATCSGTTPSGTPRRRTTARTGRGTRYDWDPMFAALKPLIESADLAICHSEVPFAAPGAAPESYPVFAAPRSIAPWIASMGWDACTTASNHSWDQGFDGVTTTAELFEANGIPHIGTFRSEAERDQPVILTTADGVRVGVVAATYGLNGFVTPEDQWWAVSQTTEVRDDLLDQAARARAAGADIVIAHVHWGTEYDHLPNADQVALADALTASPERGPRARRARPRRPADHQGQRQVGRLRLRQHGRAERGRAARRLRGHRRRLRVHRAAATAAGLVSRAAYVPTQWNHYPPGNPIRIVDAAGAHLASVRSAVNGVGRNRGLHEDQLLSAGASCLHRPVGFARPRASSPRHHDHEARPCLRRQTAWSTCS